MTTGRKFSILEARLVLAVALCSGIVLLGWRFWRYSNDPGSPVKSLRADQLSASGLHHSAPAAGSAETSPSDEQHLLKVKRADQFWSSNETEILRALHEGLPAALARRKAAAPYYHAIVAYGTNLSKSLYDKHKATRQRLNAAGMPDKKTTVDIAKIHALESCLSRYEVLGDSTTLAGDKTFGKIACELNGASELRRAMIEVERKVFDEKTAVRRLETASDETILAEMQAAIPRYQAAKQQIIAGSSLDTAHVEFLHDFDYGNEAFIISSQYRTRYSQEIDDLLEKCYYPQRVLKSLVGGVDEDDEESRRLMTVVADLYQQTRTIDDAANY